MYWHKNWVCLSQSGERCRPEQIACRRYICDSQDGPGGDGVGKVVMKHNDPQWSYKQHQDHDEQIFKENKLPSCYTTPESVDAWRHRRMHNTLLPLIRAFPKDSWITLGDGKYGSDAYFLKQNGISVLATSLSDTTLIHARDLGYLDNIKSQNAEQIGEADSSFDFVLCKESYHHFPRPPIAFYEMLRVSKKAVVLIEPVEGEKKVLDYLKLLVKKVLRNGKSTLFEPSGNYIYKVDLDEISRMMTALNYEFIAFKKINDFYHPKFSEGRYNLASVGTLITLAGIAVQNLFCFLRLMNYGLATVIAFKSDPTERLQKELLRNGFRIIFLPNNPYR